MVRRSILRVACADGKPGRSRQATTQEKREKTMSRQEVSASIRYGVLSIAALWLAGIFRFRQALHRRWKTWPPESRSIPPQISVSGISSGGYMAHQFHVAHSQHIMGAGIVAGGPYYCARGSIVDALTRCSRFAMLECLASKLDPKLCGQTTWRQKTEVRSNARQLRLSPRRASRRTPARSVRSPTCATTRSICSAAATTRSSRTR
jgi:hypothetical protein